MAKPNPDSVQFAMVQIHLAVLEYPMPAQDRSRRIYPRRLPASNGVVFANPTPARASMEVNEAPPSKLVFNSDEEPSALRRVGLVFAENTPSMLVEVDAREASSAGTSVTARNVGPAADRRARLC